MRRPMSLYTPSLPVNPSQCPRCQQYKLINLRSMRKYGVREWFKCDACDHIFTEPRETSRILEFGEHSRTA